MRLLLVSTELPEPSRGGSKCLHRLLTGNPEMEVEVLTHERREFPWPWPVHRARRGWLFYKYWHSRFGTGLQDASLSRGWELPARAARRIARIARPDFILTVAYGPALVSARRLAESANVPLASLFMDWWPDLACNHLGAPRSSHAALEREFTRLHAASRVSFHFSQGMQDELGARPGDAVLLPAGGEALPAPAPGNPAVLAYAGLATGMYAESLTAVVTSGSRRPDDRLEIMGPGLPETLGGGLPPGVRNRGFLQENECLETLRAAGALLVVLPFGMDDRRLARTSFSLKFAEYCRLGRPIIIWGPPESAIARFATETSSALVVTSPRADDVWAAFQRLQSHPALAASLADGALRAHSGSFATKVVRALFADKLAAALSQCPRNPLS
jgi:hypothetical protein